ncbi:MAG: hypothetical protein M1608_06330 [Candidatus Omnitrophica bacterium]|nr:hypothetical protein [Candidatus Omnitrophota bacterium]
MTSELVTPDRGNPLIFNVRSLLGLPERAAGRPTRTQMEAEHDLAWQVLQSMGMGPSPFFPADESWLDEYQ